MAENKITDDAVELVHLRNHFYRDSYHRIMVALLLSILVAIALSLVVGYIVLNPPRPKYFAVDVNGRITPIIPLDQPNMSNAALLQWATQAAIAAYSYNFVNYRKELQAASAFFTPAGWQEFIKATTGSNNLEAIIKKKLNLSAVATGAPVVVASGVADNGRYTWRIQLPLVITFQSSSQLSQQSLVVTMKITRVDTLYSVRGIGIEQFIASSGGF